MKSRILTAAALVLVGAGGYALLSNVTKTAKAESFTCEVGLDLDDLGIRNMKLLCPAIEETGVTDFAFATPFILDKSQLTVNISFEMLNISDVDAAFVEHALKTAASLCEDLNKASLATVNDIWLWRNTIMKKYVGDPTLVLHA